MLFAIGAALLLLALAVPAFFFLASRVVDRVLSEERRIGSVLMHAHGPVVSGPFSINADSVTIESKRFHLSLFAPSVRLADWLTFNPSESAILRVRADSVLLRLRPGAAERGEVPAFPAGLRFPVTTILEWRAFALQPAPGSEILRAGAGQWRSLGPRGLEGHIVAERDSNPFGGGQNGIPIHLRGEAVWHGPALRYTFAAQAGGDKAVISGIRDKADLRQGFDSLELHLGNPAGWLSGGVPSGMPALSNLKLAGKADWRNRVIHFSGELGTGEFHMAGPLRWGFEGRTTPFGGTARLHAASAGKPAPSPQSLEAEGDWTHPEAWPLPPDWLTWTGGFSARIHGNDWNVAGRWALPLDFEVSSGRLDSGGALAARVTTRDQSRIDLRWHSGRPGRLGFSGDISPRETWALAWTDTSVSYRSARVEGSWEGGRVRVNTRVRDPRAYGAFADSLDAVHEVTSRAYVLRSAAAYERGEKFTGSGRVHWRAPSGEREVGLRFEAGHPRHGNAELFMRFPERVVEGSADSLRFASFPYLPLSRFSRFEPRIDGDFRWNLSAGAGETDFRSEIVRAGRRARLAARAEWNADSLRVHAAELAAGSSRLYANAVLPFEGGGFAGLVNIQSIMGGKWSVRADGLRLGDVQALTANAGHSLRGVVEGEMAYSPGAGVAGSIAVDSLDLGVPEVPVEIPGFRLHGMGDSLRFEARSVSRRYPVLNDSLSAVFSGLNTTSPDFTAHAFSANGFSLRAEGSVPGWRALKGVVRVEGNFPLNEEASLRNIFGEARFEAGLERGGGSPLLLDSGSFALSYASPVDTQSVSGTLSYRNGTLRVPDLKLVPARGGHVGGSFVATSFPFSLRGDFEGPRWSHVFADGRRFSAEDFAGSVQWSSPGGFHAVASARSGSFAFPPAPYRVEGGYENLNVDVTVPPADAEAPPPKAVIRGSLRDFLFQRRIGLRDMTAFFTAFNRPGDAPLVPAPGSLHSRPWEIDAQVGTVGENNRVDTDVLRMHFMGNVEITGVYPYTLVRGRLSGIQGELGQSRQAYAMRDFEIEWDNVTLEEGDVQVTGEKRLRADCRPDTRQTCMIYVHLDGKLQNVNFAYDTDCGQNTGDPVPPSVLINSMAQGCYVAETQGGEGGYGAALALLEPAINERLSRGFARGSAGFIKSSQVTGLSALVGTDSVSLESISLEVESREVYRVGLKGRAGYHPEAKLANPMEYRLAAEYRPPVENWISDSAWSGRLRDRFSVEAAVETRPEGRGIEEERRVRQRAGLRYRYRFWSLW